MNETFVAGDFPVTIIRATGSNGVFSGEGYVQVPYLLDTKIKVKFDGIKINSERQLIAGKLVTTYDKTEQNIFEVPTIKDIDSAIKIIEKVFEKQKEIIQKQEHLEKQFAENKINKEKYEQEQEKIKELITQNDKRLDVVNQYVKDIPAITEVENKNVTNQINSFKSSGSKQSFDESNADKLLTTFKNFKKRETEQFIADFERVIKDFEKKEQGKTLFLEIELDTISKKVLDHKFAEHILPDKENDYLGTYFGDFKLSKEGNTHYVWEGNYWTKIIDNGDQTYSAIVFSRVSNDIIERVTWHESDSQETIGQKIKAGKDTADFIGEFVVVAPLIMDINPTFGASKIVTRTRLVRDFTKFKVIPKRLLWSENQTILTTTGTSRVGSWMSKLEYEQMVKTSQLQKRSGGLTHILLEGKEHYSNTIGKMYVEFNIPKNTTIIRGSGKGWGIFYEEGSPRWKFYNSKGLNVAQPKVSDIKIIDRNGL
ncbi:hypothetical protein CAPN004_23720 [Capnocytophaga cynodegmi]|nr:hypothetical protein CAPN004_23720 [Capnocytophaga cynodegmi]